MKLESKDIANDYLHLSAHGQIKLANIVKKEIAAKNKDYILCFLYKY